jgi:hypothetical protein
MAAQLPVWVFPRPLLQLRLEPHRPAKDGANAVDNGAQVTRQWVFSIRAGSNLLLTCERRIMTARVRRDLWEVASGPLR